MAHMERNGYGRGDEVRDVYRVVAVLVADGELHLVLAAVIVEVLGHDVGRDLALVNRDVGEVGRTVLIDI